MRKVAHLLQVILLLIPLLIAGCHQAESTSSAAQAVVKENQVIIYSADWCGPCKTLKQDLDRRGIAYTDYDVDNNEQAREAFMRLGGRGLPTTVVGDQVILGYDPEAIVDALSNLDP